MRLPLWAMRETPRQSACDTRSKPYFRPTQMALPTAIVAKEPGATATHLRAVFTALGWASSNALVERVLADVTAAFWGQRSGYLASDMRYHDLGHTLQCTISVSDIAAGMCRSKEFPAFGQRELELTVVAALLHDSGFLKTTDDLTGTGAKYTLHHERRSCEFARRYLPEVGITASEIDDVCAAISCTGPRNRISAQTFRGPVARKMACLLVTADYVSQMSAPDYVDKLTALFTEFTESWDYDQIPAEQRMFRDLADLKRRTPDFWVKFVHPMLRSEADDVLRYLSVTGQTNAYLQAIEDNIAVVRQQSQAGLVTA